MFGKVTNALIRREADAYRAQGLQEEALRLFRKILNSSEKMPPDVRKGIEQQVLEIEAEIAGIDLEERQQVSEEQIEDYSPSGDAWNYFTHDQARSRVYRWGEDGIAGICDKYQHLCLALALWNGHDPFLKERLFGLTNSEAIHGEDVKELYYYLDATPTHSYLKMLTSIPSAPFPMRS